MDIIVAQQCMFVMEVELPLRELGGWRSMLAARRLQPGPREIARPAL
jgi:hypothetical protein